MERPHVEAIIADLIADITARDRDSITMETRLRLDSIAKVDVALYVEEEFGVGISDEEMDKFKTVDDLVDHVDKKLELE